MRSTVLHLFAGLFLLFTLTQCDNTVTSPPTSEDEEELSKPELVSPTDNSTNQSIHIELNWKRIKGAKEYQIQLSESEDFDSTLVDSMVEGSSYTTPELKEETLYYWRVKPFKRNHEGPWSDTWQFSTTTLEEAETVTVELQSPDSGEILQTTSLTFEWSSVSESADYYYQLSNDENFSDLVKDSVVDKSSIKVSDLNDKEKYFWRVEPILDSATGEWSEVAYFTIESDDSNTTSDVALISPSDGATDLPTTLNLEWEEVSEINDYRVQLATSDNFSSPVEDELVSNTSFEVSGLNYNQTYYWRVQAEGDGDIENWSSVRSFSTESETTNDPSGSRADDEEALEAIYQSAGGSGWSNRGGWSSSGMSLSDDIYGVEVANIDGELRVTSIDLKDNGLSEDIETSAWSNLTELVYLNLSFNSLSSQIPSSLGNCTKLEYLYLSRSDDVESKALDPHEHAQDGGGDLHVGKHKGSENNVWTGAVPASLGNLQRLKWFVLNWTDSSDGATDGISSVPAELFSISTLEGLQIYSNNDVADLAWPSDIGNMRNLDNLAIGGGNKTGFLTGSVSANFGNLSELRFLRLDGNPNLTLDFDQVDLSGMSSLRNASLNFIDVRGTFPKYFMDGTLPNLVGFYFNFPQGPGMTGSLSSGATGIKIVQIGYGHNITGSIPGEFWRDNQGLIQTEFAGDNLTSVGTTDLTYMEDLRNLRWKNNNIGPEKWPNLDWSDPGQLDNGAGQVQFAGNRYVFSNMLYKPSNGGGKTIFQLYKDLGLNIFSYKDQQPFGQSQTISFSVGSTVSIDPFADVVTHSNNEYQWQKDGTNISGATDRSLTISNAQSSDEGTYRLVVTNPGVPDLTLTSQPIELER